MEQSRDTNQYKYQHLSFTESLQKKFHSKIYRKKNKDPVHVKLSVMRTILQFPYVTFWEMLLNIKNMRAGYIYKTLLHCA